MKPKLQEKYWDEKYIELRQSQDLFNNDLHA